MTQYSVIGKRVNMIGGTDKVTGNARYTTDMVLPGMLYGKILRSPHPHARILNMDTGRAEKLAGVKAVATGKDTIGKKQGIWRRFPELCDEEVLCGNKAREAGVPGA